MSLQYNVGNREVKEEGREKGRKERRKSKRQFEGDTLIGV